MGRRRREEEYYNMIEMGKDILQVEGDTGGRGYR
jgi:hypothetical protein